MACGKRKKAPNTNLTPCQAKKLARLKELQQRNENRKAGRQALINARKIKKGKVPAKVILADCCADTRPKEEVTITLNHSMSGYRVLAPWVEDVSHYGAVYRYDRDRTYTVRIRCTGEPDDKVVCWRAFLCDQSENILAFTELEGSCDPFVVSGVLQAQGLEKVQIYVRAVT